MQTLTVRVQDSFMQEFLNFVENKKENIRIEKDENLAYDPYFYKRQRELQALRDNIKSGKVETISDKDFWDEIDSFVDNLER